MVWGGSGVVRVSCGGWLFRTRQLSSFPVAYVQSEEIPGVNGLLEENDWLSSADGAASEKMMLPHRSSSAIIASLSRRNSRSASTRLALARFGGIDASS
jgi:hypothetical protein